MATDIATQPTPSAPQTATGLLVGWRRVALIVLGILLLFGATYVLAWFDASRLTATYIEDAEESYAAGNYLEALQGYREWNEEQQEYETRGGYIQVEHIWQDRYAWPFPDVVTTAQARIQEIINERLTVAQAERFIQENTGRTNPYMGPIFLRLGELYEAEGDLRSAEDIYEEVEDLFSNRPELIERAQAHLARLEQEDQ